MPNPSHQQINTSQFADDAGQSAWVIVLIYSVIFAEEPSQTGRVVCQIRNKTKSRKKNESRSIFPVPKKQLGENMFYFYTATSFVLSPHKFPSYHFQQWDDFHRTLSL